jgi:hypothetical protein
VRWVGFFIAYAPDKLYFRTAFNEEQGRDPPSNALLNALAAKAYLHRGNHLELRIEGTFGSELVLVVPDGQWSWR